MYAFAISFVATKTSNLSVKLECFLSRFANGDIIFGCPMMNDGFIHCDSMNSPTNLSNKRAVVRGAEQSTLC